MTPRPPVVVDAHVHLFPPRLCEAIWRWFDAHAWKIRYRLYAEQVVEFLTTRGVERLCALCYAHKPGLSRVLNRFLAEIAAAHPQVIALGTVLPGEPDAREVLREALGALGLRGIKIHCHVQQVAPDDPRLETAYRACAEAGRPVVIHAGREPAFGAYECDVRALCGADRMARVLERHPRLTVVVPHLGYDEVEAYAALLDRHDNLWLDTTMALAGYFPEPIPAHVFPARAARLLYGSDFPNVPYEWDRELRAIQATPLDAAARAALLGGNALKVFGQP